LTVFHIVKHCEPITDTYVTQNKPLKKISIIHAPVQVSGKLSTLVVCTRVCGGYLSDRDHNERSSSRALRYYGEELGVDRTEMVVMDVLCDWDALEAVLSVRHFAIDVSKLGAPVGRPP